MKFVVLPRSASLPEEGHNVAFLRIDLWNDFSFITMFDLLVFDENQKRHEMGKVKIGYKGQDASHATYQVLDNRFEALTDDFFSLGMDVDYYRKMQHLSSSVSRAIMLGLRDIVFDTEIIEQIRGQEVFKISLLRDVSMSVIKGQYRRVLGGGAPLTDFSFEFSVPEIDKLASIDLSFNVAAESTPSTNIHAIIGRNGVGKTNLLNKMTESITRPNEVSCFFRKMDSFINERITDDYFSSLVSVSFSAFDSFEPPPDQTDPEKGACYYYIGIKRESDQGKGYLKSLQELHEDVLESISACFSQNRKKERWLQAINKLESDANFADMSLRQLGDLTGKSLKDTALSRIERMSSGHAIVFMTITKLVEKVEEKTLVLIDEPESHLHPPLLSAFTRALSELLHDRNGVAIIATHSPVVLQEIPSSCVWKILRSRLVMSSHRPDIETFGENVGVLTREVFGLEVVNSGFHDLLSESVEKGFSYEEILNSYNNQLGYEARAILRAMVYNRDGV